MREIPLKMVDVLLASDLDVWRITFTLHYDQYYVRHNCSCEADQRLKAESEMIPEKASRNNLKIMVLSSR